VAYRAGADQRPDSAMIATMSSVRMEGVQAKAVGAVHSVRSLCARCVSVDLEVSRHDGRIFHLAAVRGDSERGFEHRVRDAADLQRALDRLDAFAEDADFVLGHNLIAFDLPQLAAVRADLRLLAMPRLDTLRLNPLAFPKNPYHRLVKHYQDGQFNRVRRNDPELDARLALALFDQQQRALTALRESAPDLLAAWHGLLCDDTARDAAFDAFFRAVRDAARPDAAATRYHLATFLAGKGCRTQAAALLDHDPGDAWPLAYALAWLSVAGGNSILSPWVTHQFPRAGRIVRGLRDRACSDPSCAWCRERHDARRELSRWFRLDGFRPEPRGDDGRPLQQAIVETAMAGEHVLGILPTGTGKSLCYQLPALSRYDKTGALTVVISPLVALMADQVAGMEARGIGSAAALNGLLSMPERAEVLERLRLGDIAILIVSPEQLRSRALRRALEQREIGAWSWTRRTACRSGGTTSGPTIATSGASSASARATRDCRRCCA
jgi:ATP-dependent DNA helicase RecQ